MKQIEISEMTGGGHRAEPVNTDLGYEIVACGSSSRCLVDGGDTRQDALDRLYRLMPSVRDWPVVERPLRS